MSLEPIKIPQNVYVEDRIVGPLTLRQIIICAIGGGFSYALFATIQKTYGGISVPVAVITWMPGVLAAAVAFVRINDISLLRIFFLTLERMSKAPRRSWQPRKGIVVNIRTTAKTVPKEEAPVANKDPHLSELSSVLDNNPMHNPPPAQANMVAPPPVEDMLPPPPEQVEVEPDVPVLQDLHPVEDAQPKVAADQSAHTHTPFMRDIAPSS